MAVIELIEEPWVRFKVLFTTTEEEEQKKQLAKEAFAFVIARYSAFKFPKEKMLDTIANLYPNITTVFSDEELFQFFEEFYNEMFRRKEIVTSAELGWVEKYIDDTDIHTKIEKLIYARLLIASSHWDPMREKFEWTISEGDMLELAREALKDENLGSKRKMELAEEFRLPGLDFAKDYHWKLLYSGHYKQMTNLEIDDGTVISAVASLLENGRWDNAIDVAKRFLPERADVIEETEAIVEALES